MADSSNGPNPGRQLESPIPELVAQSTDGPDCLPTLEGPARTCPAEPSGVLENRYEVLGKLGEGGMGAVYKVHDHRLDRDVAMKVIRPDEMSPTLRKRFDTEARAVAKLDHPHVVKVFDVGEVAIPGESAPVPYLTLEMVDGGSLAKRLGNKPLPPFEAARLVAMLARAMQHAHERGILHRDLKPDNVLLSKAESMAALTTSLGCPKITDFGLARPISGNQKPLTQEGAVVGTPEYLSPEQAEGRPDVEPSTDVWALGVILFQLLSGEKPFQAPSLVDLLHKICHDEPKTLPDVPITLAILVAECLRKRPEERPTAKELAERLEGFAQTSGADTMPHGVIVKPRSRKRIGLIARMAAIVLAAVLAIVFWPRDKQPQPPENKDKPNPIGASTIRIRPIRVMRFDEMEGALPVARGRIGLEGPEEAAEHGDSVTIRVELTEPGYFYVIAFNFDGKEQLLWPASDAVAPPKRERVQIPEASDQRFFLNDPAPGGWQVFLTVASSKPLPSFSEWRTERADVKWRRYPPGSGVLEQNGFVDNLGRIELGRGTVKDVPGAPPLAELCRGLLGGGVEKVEAIAFPVRPKENPR